MERRIIAAKDQYKKLKEECKMTVDLLNKLLQNCATHVDSLEKLNNKDHRLNSKYFLTVSHYQLNAHQKILELNVELEEHLLENEISDIEHLKKNTCASTRISRTSESSICTITSPITQNSPDFLRLSEIDTKVYDKLQPNYMDAVIDDMYSGYAEVEAPEVFLATSSVLNDSVSTNTTEVFFYLEDEDNDNIVQSASTYKEIVQHIPQEFEHELIQNMHKVQLTNKDKVMSDATENDNVSKRCELKSVARRISNISDTLGNLPFMTLEEKYIKSLPKAHMPDISLKASDKKCLTMVNQDESFELENDGVNLLNETKVTKKCTFKENPTMASKTNIQENVVFEIGHRSSPLMGDICMIGFVESPSSFYIQVSDENSILIDVMATQLAEINNNTSLPCSTKLDAIDHLGKFCTLAIDGTWYRAEVLDWLHNSSSDQVYIQLIDYGNKYSISYKCLRPLPPFCRNHRFAQKCYLAYLYPPGSTKTKRLDNWPVACNEAFFNYCGDMDKSDFRITYINPSAHEKNAYEIDLVRVSDNFDDKSIGEILIEAQLAVQIIDDVEGLVKHNGMCNQILNAHGYGGITSRMTQEEVFDRFFSEIDEEPANINEAVMKYSPRDEAETCRNLRPDGTCYKGELCKWRHDVLKSGFTNDKEAVYYKAFSDLSLPAAGEEVFLTITHIVDIHCFYAQIRSDAEGITSSINDLINAMNVPQVIKKYKKLEQEPSAGEVVIAKYWNGYWYRGQIRDVNTPDLKVAEAEVYFVDFGDILTVPVSDLRYIIPEFLELPFQAVECRLYNLKHREGSDEDEERRHFESKLLGGTLKAHIVAVPGHLQVLLETTSGEDVGLQLIEEGFGELNTEHNFPAANELILID